MITKVAMSTRQIIMFLNKCICEIYSPFKKERKKERKKEANVADFSPPSVLSFILQKMLR